MKIRVYHWLYSLEPPAIGALSLGAAALFKTGLFLWVVPLFIFVVLPIMDLRSRDDKTNPDRIAHLLKPYRGFFEWVARSYMFFQVVTFALGLVCLWLLPATWPNLFGLALSLGIVNGIAIAPAHELNHTTGKVNRLFSASMLAFTGYGQFLIEHNAGHHVKVATPEDPASARLGESFWEFAPRSIFLGLIGAVKVELKRLRAGRFMSWLLLSWGLTVVLLVLSYLAAGALGVMLFISQAIIGILLLEAVNYIEHYGLLRQKNETGYEPCTHQHSWNSNKLVTNIGLFNLQRHSDHHANAARPYELLRHFEDAPQHPTGYAAMIISALFPPIWFKIMDKRVVDHYGGNVEMANIHPRKRQRYLEIAND